MKHSPKTSRQQPKTVVVKKKSSPAKVAKVDPKLPPTKIKPAVPVKKLASKKPKSKRKNEPGHQDGSDVRVVHPEIIEPDGEHSPVEPIDLNEAEQLVPKDAEEPSSSHLANTETALTTSDPLARYLSEIRRYPLLTREQEHELAVKYFESGDASAAESLVTSNLRFVVKVAAEYAKFGAKLIDLIQEGNVGLMHAVKEFNPYKGVKLITYAVWWIRGYIQEYLMRQYSMVRIGTTHTQRKLFYQLQKEKQELERLGQEAGFLKLSGRLGVDQKEVESMSQRLKGRDISLDQPLGDDDRTRLMDIQRLPYEDSIDEQLGNLEQIEVLKEKIEKIRPSLTAKEKHILEVRLLSDEPKTLQEIGDEFGTTREAVRQIEARLMNKIKQAVLGDL